MLSDKPDGLARKLREALTILVLGVVFVTFMVPSQGAAPQGDLPLALPGPVGTPMEPLSLGAPLEAANVDSKGIDVSTKSLDDLDRFLDEADKVLEPPEGTVEKVIRTAAEYRQLAEAALARHAYPQAAEFFRREAALRRQQGDTNAAEVEEAKANRYATDLALYVSRPATDTDVARLDTHARLEPPLGCYVGAFIDRDDNVRQFNFEGQKYGSVADFTTKVGKKHVSYFSYRAYGAPFPTRWVNYIHRHGAIPDIAWEPRSLADVRNDAYLRKWVDAARQANGPLFIRFASEFNGNWVRYHGDPQAYKRAFRTIYSAFRSVPNVALIWCPNCVPREGLDAYYPGDAYTDWVGVNLYSVPYLDNNRGQSGEYVRPTDLVDTIYRRFAARKPIAIGEWAASHRSSVDSVSRPQFAETKIAQFYHSLPQRYPRIKMVNWYDCDNLRHAPPHRRLNDFSLTDDGTVLDEYRRAIASAYFLGVKEVSAGQSPVVVLPLRAGQAVTDALQIEAYVRTYVQRPKVYFKIDGSVVYASMHPGRYALARSSIPSGSHVLEVLVYDDQNKFITSTRTAIMR